MNTYLLTTRNAMVGSVVYYAMITSVRNHYASRYDYSVFYKTIIEHFLNRNPFFNEGFIIGILVGRYIEWFFL